MHERRSFGLPLAALLYQSMKKITIRIIGIANIVITRLVITVISVTRRILHTGALGHMVDVNQGVGLLLLNFEIKGLGTLSPKP